MARRAVAIVGVLAFLVLAGSGCGGDDGGTTESSPSAGGTAFPVTVEHQLGSTVVEAAPQRIVALSNEEDTLAVLGVTPIAYAGNPSRPGGAYPWLEGRIDLSSSTELEDVYGAGLNVEQIAALEPDLILATNFYGLDQYYEQLRAIAPTVGPPVEAGIAPWQETSRAIGRSVGRLAEVEAAIADTEGRIASFGRGLPGLAGRTFSSSYYYEAGTFAVIDDPTTTSVLVFDAIGMVLAPAIETTVVDRSLSLENVDALDADFMAIGFASDDLRADLTSDPLYLALGAVADGRVAELDEFQAGVLNNPTMLNVPWLLDELRATLEKVAVR
jgi:iron complex transport system substrate-binding protein